MIDVNARAAPPCETADDMTDQPLFAAQVPIFPRRVRGRFRRLKWAIMAATLAIYYAAPWIRWDRGPNLPDQAVLVDLAGRRFYFFWIEIWPHEFYFVAGLLIMAGLGLFLFTSALGRVWCGYACPQTVWTDLFLAVERRIEGDRNARVRLHDAPWDARKWRLRLTKWAAWLAISVATGGAWVFYFADAPTLLRDLVALEAPAVAYATIAILTATTFTLGGFLREQVCIYMCPWPRIQGAMMDPGTLTVGYRDWRGEPRGKGRARRREVAESVEGQGASVRHGAGAGKDRAAPRLSREGEVLGDCIDCMACVNVCPMGIDIREGQQMECITCALCIDACDEVMAKIGRPRGLIDYVALSDIPAERAGAAPAPVARHVLRPRNLAYLGLWALIGLGLVLALWLRPTLAMSVAPVRNPTHVVLSDGSVRNDYVLRVQNRHGEARDVALSVAGGAELTLTLSGYEAEGIARAEIEPDAQARLRVQVTAPPGSDPAHAHSMPIELRAEDPISGEAVTVETTFDGRETR